MKGEVLQVRVVGGMGLDLPQPPESATLVENWTVDRDTQGFSSRVGYEKYRPNPAFNFDPWGSLGRIDSLFVYQGLAGGARQTILFESGGKLYLYYEVGQNSTTVALADRSTPTSTESASVYTQVGDRIVVTNGQDSPVVIRPWPLPKMADLTADVAAQIIRPLGWTGPPPQPITLKVATLADTSGSPPAGTTNSPMAYTGDSTANWYPSNGKALSFPSVFGMGRADGGDDGVGMKFQFKVSFISDTGSESPLSQEAEVTWSIPANDKGYRYCPSLIIPVGPKGTVARRIYRTIDDGSVHYFVADVRNNSETLFHAFRRGNALGFEAPATTDSAPFPASRARVCAAFKDCLFVDGGANESETVFFSKPGYIDQFGSTDYLRLPSNGGAVTGLYPYYNNLIVLRENGIDVVTGSYPGFTAQTVTRQIACRAPNTLDSVPGMGVFLLAQDGVYLLRGGLDGGAVFDVIEVGKPVDKELRRLTLECAPRSIGMYNPNERAYHLYIPVDGNDRPNLGLVFHLDKRGWSLRTGFPVGCLARTHNNELIFGHHTGAESGDPDSERGLFVVSSILAMGGSIVADNYQLSAAATSRYESAWHDFGDAQVKKQVQYVTLWVLTGGNVVVNLTHYKDFNPAITGTNTSYITQPPDQADQPVYGSAVIGTSPWEDGRLVPIRIPVAQQSCSWFKFAIETQNDLTLVGYELEFAARNTRVVAGKTL